MSGMGCQPRKGGCSAATPCLVADADARERIGVNTFCAGLDRQSVHEQMMLSYGKPAHHCLKNNEELARKGETSAAALRSSGATLRITGPVSDGFWVRALTVMAHAAWARRVGLAISVAYRSTQDAYLDAADTRHDGWTQFFEPLGLDAGTQDDGPGVAGTAAHSPRTAALPSRNIASSSHHAPPRLLQLDCYAAARAWEAYSNYAPTFRAAVMQRRQRIELVSQLPVEPRKTFRHAASTYWRQMGLGGKNGTLGIHLRGTDKPGGTRRGAKAFLPLMEAYLCHRPHARVFVATDDERLLSELQEGVTALGLPPSRVVWRRDVLRGNSSLNPGFHADELSLSHHPSLAYDVMVDTLLLSKCDFLLKSISSVSEFAIYWNPHLHEHSYDVQLRGQPPPAWAKATCSTRIPRPLPSAAVERPSAPKPPEPVLTGTFTRSPIHDTLTSKPTLAAIVSRWQPTPTCPRLWVDPNGRRPMLMQVPISGPVLPTARLLGLAATATRGAVGMDANATLLPTRVRIDVAGATAAAAIASSNEFDGLPKEGVCRMRGEQAAFKAQCGAAIRQMDATLSSLRYTRGLAIEYVGRSVWGVGHVLTLAYALHHVCHKLDRFCYVRLWDSQLDELFSYSNGDSWAPAEEELAKYPAPTVDVELSGAEASNVALVYERVRNETAPLVRVRLVKAAPLIASESMPWTVPLVASRKISAARLEVRHGALDRCFCRYVTQPTFGAAGEAVVAEAMRRVLAIGARGGVALHMRTGLADISDGALRTAADMASKRIPVEPRLRASTGSKGSHGGTGMNHAGTAEWLYAACSDEALRALPSGLVLSDAPGLTRLLTSRYTQLFTVGAIPRAAALHTNASSGHADEIVAPLSARSWGNAFGPKLAAAADVVAAGVAAEVHISRYSTMLKPAVVRSMCIRRVVPFGFREEPQSDRAAGGRSAGSASMCPRFDIAFLRNLHILTSDKTKYACMQEQLHAHPCKEKSARACREQFTAAMI